MTKKHYTAIAAIINYRLLLDGYNRDYNGMLDDNDGAASTLAMMGKLANYFEKDNKLFQRDKFIDACKKTS